MRRLKAELRPHLFRWDPIGFAEDLPDDEYDCVVSPLLAKLRSDPSIAELTRWLGRYAESHFGTTAVPETDRLAAEAVLDWWDGARHELPSATL